MLSFLKMQTKFQTKRSKKKYINKNNLIMFIKSNEQKLTEHIQLRNFLMVN